MISEKQQLSLSAVLKSWLASSLNLLFLKLVTIMIISDNLSGYHDFWEEIDFFEMPDTPDSEFPLSAVSEQL